MKKLNQWLVAAALGVAMHSSGSYAETPIESFMARVQSQQFNTQVLTVPISLPPAGQMYFEEATSPISIDPIRLFNLPDFKIELPGLNNLYAIKEHVKSNRFGGKTWVGDILYLDPYGFETGTQGRAYFVERNGALTGTIHTSNAIIQIFPDGAGGQIMISSDPSDFDDESEPVQDENSASEQAATAAPIIGDRIDGESPATLDNPYTIDIMFVVPEATTSASNDIDALLELIITSSNDVLANSLVPARLRLIHTHHTDYVETANDMRNSLYDLQKTSDGNMDEIHAIRESIGADVVMLISSVNGSCGIGFVDSKPTSAFTVSKYTCVGKYTPIHELGHNFGTKHNPEISNNTNYSFGYGWQNTSTEPYWRTVMSYDCDGFSCPRVPYFSTPKLTYNGLPLGDAELQDNARVVKIRVAEVAGFYPSGPDCREHSSTNDQHVSAGRAYTESSGGFFPTTTYRAIGSDDSLGSYGFTSNTLAEESAGFFSIGNCSSSASSETPFAPEVQNLSISHTKNNFTISGEVFDANSDDISGVHIKLSNASTWHSATIDNGLFTGAIPVAVTKDMAVDIRTTDVTGESFTFTKVFGFNFPQIQQVNFNIYDQDVQVNMQSINTEHPATVMFYQIDGEGDTQSGSWEPYPVVSTYWTFELTDLPVGPHTIHMYSLDSDSQTSNIVSLNLDILAPAAPMCGMFGSAPSRSGVAGQIEVWGSAEDLNSSDILLEYRVNAGNWASLYEIVRSNGREIWQFNLPETFNDGDTVNIETRATDSTGLQSLCGSVSHSVTYPSGNEAPSCTFNEIGKHEGQLRYYMLTSDANGDQQQMYVKESSQSEWTQLWPSTLSYGLLPIPGFGEFTIQGRVIDASGLEGFCEQNTTIIDEGYTPFIEYANGFYDTTLGATIVNIEARDFDGEHDIVSTQYREVGSVTWQNASRTEGTFWQANLSALTGGQYEIEIRATDTSGHIGEIYNLDVSIESEEAPVITSAQVTTSNQSASITVTATVGDNEINQLTLTLDGTDIQNYANTNAGTWNISYENLTFGSHQLEVTVTDTANNTSEAVTRNFNIEQPQTCITAANSEHVNEARAYSQVIGQTCYGTFCFGGTTTYFANGSDDNMGTNASATTSLTEVSVGIFEIGQCNVVDTTAPVISLNGNSPMNVSVGSTFVDPGATANDNIDGNISSSIVVTGTVNTASIGTYILAYNVSDTAGNAATQVSRTVNIVAASSCFTSTLIDHTTAGRAYTQYSLYYATGTATYLGSTYTDANTIVTLEETTPGNWNSAGTCN